MFLNCVCPDDLCITNEEISEQIRNNKNREWRSYKEFQEFLDGNVGDIEWKVIGWVSQKTLDKWFNNIEMRDIDQDLWILVRGNSYWLVYSFAFAKKI